MGDDAGGCGKWTSRDHMGDREPQLFKQLAPHDGVGDSGLVRDITERKQAASTAEALRASERFARGQVNAFTRTVEALAMESETDGLVGHVLRTITAEFDAHSSSVWRRDHENGGVNFEVAFESSRLMTKSDARMVAVKPYLPIHEFWPSREDFLEDTLYQLGHII
jgi:hypothetical protein